MKFIVLLITIFIISFSCTTTKESISYSTESNIDTVQCYFLYECNVPYSCFSRFDQIEQSNNIIRFDEKFRTKDIEDLYSSGVFYFSFPEVISKYINNNKRSLFQNKQSIQSFDDQINYIKNKGNKVYAESIIYDKRGILSYKKIYGKFIVYKLGYLEQLIPNTKNYVCCYSNKKVKTYTFFIKDVLEFKIY